MSIFELALFAAFVVVTFFVLAGWYNRKQARKALEQRIATAGERFERYDQKALSEISAGGLNLLAGEVCYSRTQARLLGFKTVRGSMAYHGPVIRIPIAKGISYRAALFAGGGETTKEIRPLAHGELYLTNKRIIFRGEQKNNSVYLNKILEMTLFYGDNTIRIDKDNGPPILLDGFDVEAFWYRYKRVANGRYAPIDNDEAWKAELGEVDA